MYGVQEKAKGKPRWLPRGGMDAPPFGGDGEGGVGERGRQMGAYHHHAEPKRHSAVFTGGE